MAVNRNQLQLSQSELLFCFRRYCWDLTMGCRGSPCCFEAATAAHPDSSGTAKSSCCKDLPQGHSLGLGNLLPLTFPSETVQSLCKHLNKLLLRHPPPPVFCNADIAPCVASGTQRCCNPTTLKSNVLFLPSAQPGLHPAGAAAATTLEFRVLGLLHQGLKSHQRSTLSCVLQMP